MSGLAAMCIAWIFIINAFLCVVSTAGHVCFFFGITTFSLSSFSVAILVTGSIGADVAAKAEVAVPMADTTNASASARLQIVFFFMVCYAPFFEVFVVVYQPCL